MKYAINLDFGYDGVPIEKKLLLIKETGFDGVFLYWENGDDLKEIADKIKESGLVLQSIHGPMKNGRDIWEEGKKGDEKLEILKKCVDECARLSVRLMICHVSCGFGKMPEFAGCPTINESGILRFEKLLDYAEKKDIKIAFENAEDEEIFEIIKDRLFDKKTAGFCIDTGHESCYNRGMNIIEKYGTKLCATHINDNLGVTGKVISWHDDLHMLPFDGKINWDNVASRIKKTGYNGFLTLEVFRNEHRHDMYKDISCEEFLKKGFEKLSKLDNLICW